MFRPYVVSVSGRSRSEEELKKTYGVDTVVTRVGRFNLIHLDRPDPEEVVRRKEEFDPDDWFDDDCPLCRILREEGGDILYDGSDDEEGDS